MSATGADVGTHSSTSSSNASTALTAQQVLTDLLARVKDVDLADLVPASVRFELDQLELELLEGTLKRINFFLF